jgi:hypothetical protein
MWLRMMSYPVVLMLLAPALSHGQTSRIQGRIMINPQVPDPIDVVLELQDLQTSKAVHHIVVDQRSPRRFNGFVPPGISDDLAIRVLIKAPEGYVPLQTELVKRACCAFSADIHLKRKADAYIQQLLRGINAADDDRAIYYLTGAVTHADTLSQKLEAHRRLGHVYAENGMFAEQQDVLKMVYQEPGAARLTPARKKVYWTERLDGMLLWTNYNNLYSPERDFGLIVAGDSGPRQTSWVDFLRDFKTAYPAAAVDENQRAAAAVSDQLRIVKQTLETPE